MTREFDEKNAAKSRAKCAEMAEDASTGKRVLTVRERQILDMWPRFEDGEPVWFGDKVNEVCGEVSSVYFDDKAISIYTSEFDHLHLCDGERVERVERPALKVCDADGVEINVGDTVRLLDGIDDELVVEEIDDESGWVRTRSANGACLSVYNTHLTHIAPDSWERLEEDAKKTECGYFGINGLTIRRCRTCSKYDSDVSCDQAVKLDIIRRAKALAGIEVD